MYKIGAAIPKMPIRICHIITDLDIGGAEMMLYKFLAASSKNARFEHIVISLLKPGKVGALIRRSGVKLYSLDINHGISGFVKNLFYILRVLYEFQPDIVQGWMYHANISALLAKLIVPQSIVSWNIRQALYNIRYEKKLTRLIIKMGAAFSRWPDNIIYNSHIGSSQHTRIGYHPGNQDIIPNGFNVNLFKPDGNHRKEIRTLLEISDKDVIIGFVARYHPVKDHLNFIKAAGIIQKKRKNVFYVLIGRKLDRENDIIVNALKREGVFCRTRLLGEQKEIFRLFPAFDIATLCSVSEGFPNVIGEAMACGIPCVATDTGDSRQIMDNTGLIVPPRDPNALASAWGSLIDMDECQRTRMGRLARQRIARHFSIEKIVMRYETIYSHLASYRPRFG